MHIVLLTPLYPPDTAGEAQYAKECARRLSQYHKVSIVLYGNIPESLQTVSVTCVQKRYPLLVRMFLFWWATARAVRTADAIMCLNGPSVELPFLGTYRKHGAPLIFVLADNAAHTRAKKHPFLNFIESLVAARASCTLTNVPGTKPEILPFAPYPTLALEAYEASWRAHLQEIQSCLP